MSGFNIRSAREEDVDEIFRMTNELAAYLNEPEAVLVTPEMLRMNQTKYKCVVVEDKTTDDSISVPLIGFAQYMYKFSGWKGWVLMLDSLYVAPGHRNKGIGSALYQIVARDAAATGCNFMEILVHDWNSEAKGFYKAKGAYDYTEKMKVHLFRMPISELEKLSKPN
ncbi:diamine acetyltransferase 2-like [Pecten maximus]|uniref:diamine acetyltransferase 2-like n=1 Tax=Pecten maximus TaxID=6579 RepID=UPI00145845C7|nr:diamine acetyltransferase 2-like [Pecten maximus]